MGTVNKERMRSGILHLNQDCTDSVAKGSLNHQILDKQILFRQLKNVLQHCKCKRLKFLQHTKEFRQFGNFKVESGRKKLFIFLHLSTF